MLHALSNRIDDLSNGWVTFVALIVFVLFTALVLPNQASSAEGDTAGAGSPDLSFYYTAGDLYRMAEAYGEDGRQAYVRARFTFDIIWPIVYTFFLVTAISWLSRKAFSSTSLWQRANLVPLLAALFDLLENSSTSLVMIRYPSETAVIATLAGIFTSVKWILVGASFLLFLSAAVVAGYNWLKGKSGNGN